jgi:DNA-binding PadR family transcriptional regulator
VKKLARLELLSKERSELGLRGRDRKVWKVTPSGRRRLERCLSEPVDHVRDIRTLLMLKLVFLA